MIAGAAGTTERSPKSIGSLLAARPIAKLASWVQYSVVDFRILGPLEVWDPDRPLPLGGGKQRALLAILLLEANRVVSTERLIELLWGEEAPETVGNTLQVTVSQLRKILEPGHVRGDPYKVLVSQEPGYLIRISPEQLDLSRFEQLRRKAHEARSDADWEAVAGHLHAALALWRGMPLSDLAQELYVITEANRLNEMRMQAIEDRLEAELTLGRHADIVGEIQSLVAQHPLRERLRGQLMLALYRSGRQGDASNVFHETRAALVEQLGMEPSPALQKLFKAILNQDPSLDLPIVERRTPTNLPLQLTSFVGRRSAIEELRDLLSGYRLVTLSGAGGVGKTRLAMQLASEVLHGYRDGVWLVELASVTNPELVPQAVATVLDVREQAGVPLSTTLSRYLAARETLMLLDNCEHLVTGVAGFVETILQTCPRVRALCTSREPLKVRGEIAWRVPSLQVPDPNRQLSLEELSTCEAIVLFCERAKMSAASFALTERTASAVIDICQHLDGIPLGIELATAKLNVLSVDQIAERLGDRFQLLTGGSRTVLPRQQTLQATIDWSHDLLDERGRVLLRRLAAFLGGFSLEAAESVCSSPPLKTADIVELLEGLVEKSFVLVDGLGSQPRYDLLETIRQYASQRLQESGEFEAIRARHLSWFLSFAKRVEGAATGLDQLQWLDAFEKDHDNLRLALAWSIQRRESITTLGLAAAMGMFWRARGYVSEGRQILAEAVAADSGGQPALRASALAWAAILACDQSDDGLAEAFAEESVKLSRESSNWPAMGFALRTLAILATTHDEYERAGQFFEESLAAYSRGSDTAGAAKTLTSFAHLANGTGDTERSKELIEKSLKLSQSVGDREAIANAQDILGEAEFYAGNFEASTRLLRESINYYREVGEQPRMGIALHQLGMLLRCQGEFEQAIATLNDSLRITRDLNDQQYTAYALSELGVVAREQLDYGRAQSLIGESLRAVVRIGDRWATARCVQELGAVAAEQGDLDRGGKLLGAAESLRQAIGVPVFAFERVSYERRIETLKSRMGNERLERIWAAGREMELDTVLALALSPAPGADPQGVEAMPSTPQSVH